MKRIIQKKLKVSLEPQVITLPKNAELVRVGVDGHTKEPSTWWQIREIDEDETQEIKVRYVTRDRPYDNATKYLGCSLVKSGDQMVELFLLEDFSDE